MLVNLLGLILISLIGENIYMICDNKSFWNILYICGCNLKVYYRKRFELNIIYYMIKLK